MNSLKVTNMFPCDCAMKKRKYNKKGITYFGSRKDNLLVCVCCTQLKYRTKKRIL